MKPKLSFHRIPIYDLRLWIGVAKCGQGLAQRKKLDWAFGPSDDYRQCCGQVFYHRTKAFVQLDPDELSHALIAHEVFHIVNRLLDYIELPLTDKTHESHAYLTGYITELIYKDLARWKIPVQLLSLKAPSNPTKK